MSKIQIPAPKKYFFLNLIINVNCCVAGSEGLDGVYEGQRHFDPSEDKKQPETAARTRQSRGRLRQLYDRCIC